MAGTTPPPVSGNAPAALRAEDPRQLGVYQVLGRLGQGGMGSVFLGRAPDGTAVAIKVIRAELAERPEFRARFRREAESARRVRRFTTAAVLDADPDGPQPYLVTEYVEGPTLSRLVTRRGPLRPADLEQLALSVATALSAIHAAGIVHRDLTPANVLLSPVGPKVIDFGLAREFEGSSEISRNVRQAIGTPGYMAPEQILDSPVTSAADVFAWGAITIFAATGRPPFGDGRMEVLLYRILHEPANAEGVPGELSDLVEAAMRKEPTQRPTAEALRVALMSGGALLPAPVAPPAPAPEEPERRRGRRRGRGGSAHADAAGAAGALDAAASTSRGPDARPPAATGTLTPPPATQATQANATVIPRTPTTPASTPPVPPSAPTSRGPVTPSSGPRSAAPGFPIPTGIPPVISRPPTPSAGGFGHAGGPHPGTSTPSGPPGYGQSPGPAPGQSQEPLPGHQTGWAGETDQDEPDEQAGDRGRRGRIVLVAGGLTVLVAAAVTIPLLLRGGPGGTTSTAGRGEVSAALAAEADAARPTDPKRAARLSLAAYRIAPTRAAERSMIASFTTSTAVALPAGKDGFTDVAFSADGSTAAATDSAGGLRLWSLGDGTRPTTLAEVPGEPGREASGVVFTRDGLATGGSGAADGANDAGWLWSLADRGHPNPAQMLESQGSPVHRLTLSADRKLLVTAGEDRSVGLWDVSDPAHPTSPAPLIGRGPTTDVALRTDGGLLAIAGVNGMVDLWDISDRGHPVQRGTATGHLGAVNTVAFVGDGTRMVTGGDDHTVRLWDISDPAKPAELHTFQGHQAAVTTIVSVGENAVVSADSQGVLLGWDLGAGATGFDPTPISVGDLGQQVVLATDPAAGRLLAAGADGSARLGVTDPARLAALACRQPANRIDAAEWNRDIPGLPYQDPCPG